MARARKKKARRARHTAIKNKDTLGNRAIAAHNAGEYAKAEAMYRQLLQEHPNSAPLLASIGQVCLDQNRFEEAIEFLQRSVTLDASNSRAIYNLGLCYHKLNDHGQAIHYYQQALKKEPELVSAHINLAAIAYLQQNFVQTIKHLETAIRLQPNAARALGNLAIAYANTGRVKEGLNFLRQALALDHSLSNAHSNYLLDLHYDPDIDAESLFQEHLAWAERHAKPLASHIPVHKKLHLSGRKLRIGYLSPDFRLHSVAYFFVPILKSHDREQFEIICYSDTDAPDELTSHLRSLAPHWRETCRLSDEALCQLIREDKIDILIELSGHTSGNRLTALARKPAPIQVSYLGYPNTTGLATMDYRLTDAWADPPGKNEHLYTEKLVRLATGFLCYQPPVNVPECGPLPCQSNGYITFGSFNTLKKINSHVIKAWAEIIKSVPGSHLVLKAKGLNDEQTRQRYLHYFVDQGIDAERIEILPPEKNMLDHLAQYQRIDIALDTFPYNGTTTTCEALWMGVPVIVLEGDRHVSRVGVSIMKQASLEEFIASDLQHYQQLAINLANEKEKLAILRRNLRNHLKQSLLTNAKSFTQELEQHFRAMWHHYLTSEQNNIESPPSPQPSTAQISHKQIHFDQQTLYIEQEQHTLTAPIETLPASIAAPLAKQAWFHPESTLLEKLIETSQNVFDLNAEIGIFVRFAMPHLGSQSAIWALEPNPLLRDHLRNNICMLHQTWLIEEPEIDLERFCSQQNIATIDLIRFSGLNELANYLGANIDFFHHHTPMIVITPETEFTYNMPVLQQLAENGYQGYRLAPALNCLIPMVFDQASNQHERCALFFCKPDRAGRLALNGLLIQSLDNLPSHQPEAQAWRHLLARYPYAAPYIAEWHGQSELQPHAHQYHQALSLYAESRHPEQTPGWRYGRLLEAFENLIGIIDYQPSLPRLLSTARMASDLGLRESASDILRLLIQHLESADKLDFNEAFLSPSANFDERDPHGDLAGWCLAALIDALEHNRASNVLASDDEDLNRLEQAIQIGANDNFILARLQALHWRREVLAGDNGHHGDSTHTGSQSHTTIAPHPETKPQLAIIYHLARSGGTLISKCLACIEGNLLLSEVHPLISVTDPLDQAQQWFQLFDQDEYQQLKQSKPPYSDIIHAIHGKALQRHRHLILRDWSHIDFTAVPFVDQPSYRLSHTELLKESFDIRQIATVRHPIDTFLSLSKLAIMQGKLDLDQYLRGFKQFAIKAKKMGFIRYEDFCANPQAVMRQICATLNVAYDDQFINRFANYAYITGEKTSSRSGAEIKLPPPREISRELRMRFEANTDYWQILELLGYSHTVC